MKLSSESDLRLAWKLTVAICAVYTATLTVFLGLVFYDLSVADDAIRAKILSPSAQLTAEKVD